MQSQVEHIKADADKEILKVMQTASKAQETQRKAYADVIEQEKAAARESASTHGKGANDSSDDDWPAPTAAKAATAAKKAPPVDLTNATPVDLQLIELQAMVDQLSEQF